MIFLLALALHDYGSVHQGVLVAIGISKHRTGDISLWIGAWVFLRESQPGKNCDKKYH